jgi:hypothetical protein
MAEKQKKPQSFSRFGLKILVHENRIEIRDGLFPLAKKSMIPFSNIVEVGVSSLTKRLEITTNDGKKRKYALGGFGKAQACRDAIAERL